MKKKGLLLREFHSGDVDRLVTLLNNQEVTKFLSSRIPSPYTVKDADWWISTGCKEGYVRAMELDGDLVGCIGVETGTFEESRCGEIGYWIGQPYWGQGLGTAAVTDISSYIFSNTATVRLFAPVFAPNRASIRVLEKCGYELEGVFRKACFKDGMFYDKHIYAKIR